VEDLPEFRTLDAAAREAFSLLKIDTVSVIPDRDSIDLAAIASRKALDAAGISIGNVGLIILLESRTPKYFMSSEVTRLQDTLGAERAFCFSIGGLGCANVNAAIRLASSLLQTEPGLGYALVAAGSKPAGKQRYREAMTVVGDAGMGLVLGRPVLGRIRDMATKTEGRYWDLYRVEYRDDPDGEFRVICKDARLKLQLAIASYDIFRELNEEVCRTQGISAIDGLIMQNLSMAAFGYWEKALNSRFAPICRENCRRFGHLGSIDILLNFMTGLQRGDFAEGDILLAMNNSPVACWSSALIEVGR